MTKKLIAFDLDDTLAVTKSPISDRMSILLGRLLASYDVCIISGGTYDIFIQNVISRLEVPGHLLEKLHLMPTCGTRYYRYNSQAKEWQLQYANDLSDDQKKRTIHALEQTSKEMGLWEEHPTGEIIEDRLSQITYSALGQQASPQEKYAWAEKNKAIRFELRAKVAAQIPDLEVRVGGTTSTDVTLPGVDKAYGMQKLIDALTLSRDEVLFMGDKLSEGGNDYPVKAIGIDTIAVDGWESTAYAIEGLLAVTP